MRTRVGADGAITLAVMLASSPAAATPLGWGRASSIARDALVAGALGLPTVHGDWTGDLQAGGSLLLGGGAAYGLKQVIHEERPDHSDRKSFPSAHTAQAFAAAASLENRYGWQAGIPAFTLAGLVGVARVEARKHHWYDVAAGAAIGAGSGFLLTSPRSSNIRMTPWGDAGGGGLALAARF